MSSTKNIHKYLQIYAEPEVKLLQNFPKDRIYKNVVVIPCFKEKYTFLDRLFSSVLATQKVLLILVINQPDNASLDEDSVAPLNQSLVASTQDNGVEQWQNKNLTLIDINNTELSVLLVDRFNKELRVPSAQGVGLARKVGADIATELMTRGQILSPWICSTDADVTLPDNYFSELLDKSENTSALIYEFSHRNSDSAVSKATQRYENALRYYVDGLQWAGSAYAFHTIGSTLAINYTHYCQVRGFPKRAAGEDFYILNKLAKLAPIKTLDETVLLITPRESDRVPFGTGPAVSKIMSFDDPTVEYLYYHPAVFVELKNFLSASSELWEHLEHSDKWCNNLSDKINFALKKLRFDKIVTHIRNNAKNNSQAEKHLFQWFDAFRTLKFIHYLQDEFYPAIPLVRAIDESPFSNHTSTIKR